MKTLNLTKQEIQLILSVSNFDIYTEFTGGWDGEWIVCPSCKAILTADQTIADILSKEEFQQLVKSDPAAPNELDADDIFYYVVKDNDFYFEKIKELYPNRLLPSHKSDCRLDELKALGKKMKDFLAEE